MPTKDVERTRRIARRSKRTVGGQRSVLNVQLTPAERAMLEEMAATRQVSLSRALVDAALHQSGTRTEDGAVRIQTLVDELRWFRRQLTGVATNMNQVAHQANIDGDAPSHFRYVLSQVEVLVDTINDALNEVD